MMERTSIAINAPISLFPLEPTSICTTTGIVLYLVLIPMTR